MTTTNITFTLDGNQELEPYTHKPTETSGAATGTFEYNVTVLSQTGLENSEHTLVMKMQPGSWIAFDWAQYT